MMTLSKEKRDKTICNIPCSIWLWKNWSLYQTDWRALLRRRGWSISSRQTMSAPAPGVVVDPVEGSLLDIEYDGLLPAAHHLTQVNDRAHICCGWVQPGEEVYSSSSSLVSVSGVRTFPVWHSLTELLSRRNLKTSFKSSSIIIFLLQKEEKASVFLPHLGVADPWCSVQYSEQAGRERGGTNNNDNRDILIFI